MGGMNAANRHPACEDSSPAAPTPFRSDVVDRVRASGNVWDLPGGQLLLPSVCGFCGGVRRALAMLDEAITRHPRGPGRLFLLGQIIHNPWVNDYFRRRGVVILSPDELVEPADAIGPSDWAVITAFGVPVTVERRLRRIGCRIIDTSCGNVRRLWDWAEHAVGRGFGVLIYGRADHDETVVTTSRLADVGGKYLVVGSLDETRRFCDMVAGAGAPGHLGDAFGEHATNAESVEPLGRLAQVSQTTMLYDETKRVRELIRGAFEKRFGAAEAEARLMFEPTVCRATQQRQNAAVELCRANLDLAVVVGGFGSSNTRHLYELAGARVPAWFIEDADAIRSAEELHTIDIQADRPVVVRDWLPKRRPLRIGVLAGASSPEIVVGQVLQGLAALLGGNTVTS